MKITRIEYYLASEWRTFLFVTVETDTGIVGVGEAGLTGRELAVAGIIEHLRPQLLGQDPAHTEHIWQSLWRGGFFPGGPVLSSAISAIDMALWDIKGKALGTPVSNLLGGPCRKRVATYCHIGGGSPEQVAANGVQAVSEGWRFLRIELWPEGGGDTFNPRRAIANSLLQWEALRDAVGEDIEICVDVHTRLELSDAINYCRAIEDFRPYFVEDPLRSELALCYDALRQQTSVPLAAGEQFAGKWPFARLFADNLIDYARLDLAIVGGLTEARKIAAIAELYGINIAVHNPIGPVSTAACLHFNLAVSNFGVMELPRRPGEVLGAAFGSAFSWHRGDLLPSSAAGLGLEFNPDNLYTHTFTPTDLPRLEREDGSFCNW